MKTRLQIAGLGLLSLVWMAMAAEPTPPARVDFNFDQADVRMLIRLVGETTGRRFVIPEAVKGKVTVVSPEPIPVADVYPMFLSILEAQGYSVVDRDGSLFIVPLPENALAVSPGSAEGTGGLVTRIYLLRNVDATEVARAIEPLVRGGKAGVSAFSPSGHLIVTDLESNQERIAVVLKELDREGAARSLEVIPLEHASADVVAEQVSAALSAAGNAGQRVSQHIRQVAEGGSATQAETLVVPAPQANSLILVGPLSKLAELKRLVASLDVEPSGRSGRLHAIMLKYLSAEEAAKSLNALLARSVPKEQAAKIGIEANPASNALLVESAPGDFEWIRALVEEIDRMPQQVMIEILIAEVTLDHQLDLGVEWSTVDAPGGDATLVVGRSRPGESDGILNAVTGGTLAQGLSLGLVKGVDASGMPRMPLLIEALQQNRDVRILSSVPLWAQNNLEASVSVVDNIPVLRSTIEGGGGTTRDIIQNIDRVDVGIKLKVTPHVNPEQQITLKLNPSIEAILDPGPEDQKFAPTISKREVNTTVTVPDRATVVISGLIREDRFKRVGKIPLLGDIPFLGTLFRYTTDQKRRSNLLIFVTPTLVTDMETAAEFKKTLESRANLPAKGPDAAKGE